MRARPAGLWSALLPFIATFVVGRDGITGDEARAWVTEQQQLGARGEFYFASTQVCFTATRRST